MLRPRHLAAFAVFALVATACGGDDPEAATEAPPVAPADEPAEAATDEPTEAATDEPTEAAADEPAAESATAPGRDALVDAMVADITGEEDPLTADEAEARCVAERIVDQVGVDRLAAEGITAETTGDITEGNFSEEEIDTIVGTMFDCVDVQASFAASMVAEVGEEAAACLGQGMTEDFAKRLFASSFSSEDEDFTALLADFTALYESCGVPLG